MKGYFRKRGEKWSFTIDIGRDPLTGKRKQKQYQALKQRKKPKEHVMNLFISLILGV